jgi:pyruvate, orthophosphate dikinase
MKKYVYSFGAPKAEGDSKMRNLLGGKGSGLAEMSNLGIPVPPGFTITTEACIYYYQNNEKMPDGLLKEVSEYLKKLEAKMGMGFGDRTNPLLVSIRSGARASMPGMMDTVLNLGLNDETIKGMIQKTGNERFAYDSYRRFIMMFSDVVLQIEKHLLAEIFDGKKKKLGIKLDTDLSAGDLKEIIAELKAKVKEITKLDFPQDPAEQLWKGIGAVFGSWNNQRAKTYRKLNNIPDDWGTAVNVQAMVFGNMGNDCATGVAFTRDPSTGERKFFGEYLVNAQGEDVVAGIRTPQPVNEDSKKSKDQVTLQSLMPNVYKELENIYKKLEKHFKDMQDIEFTIQQGKLWMLQTRTGKRPARAALKIAVDMVNEGLIDKEEAIMRLNPQSLDQLLHPMFDPKAKRIVLAKGLPASPGAAVGQIVFSADDAEEMKSKGEAVILVRMETSPEDVHGMNAAQGILTSRGGMTSHAAVVARGMGKCCIVGCGDISIDHAKQEMTVKGKTLKRLDWISIDGSTGEVIDGKVPTTKADVTGGEFGTYMKWADEIRKLKIRTNADNGRDARVARDFGAEGIGLCRTEHMFFEADRIEAVREMIVAETKEAREKALARLLPYQKNDFKEIFEVMTGLPVTIRYLDPPLHEFLPQTEGEIEELAKSLKIDFKKLHARIDYLKEFNPMLGHRGCRLGITYPEIYDMQTRAIMEAACEVEKEKGATVIPEIMVPVVGDWREIKILKEIIIDVCEKTLKKYNSKIKYLVGTMIELPRAALTADEIAKEAEFFSYGTNDMTQTTWGLSRDDSGKFLGEYIAKGIMPEDPFASLDIKGVGEIVRIGTEKGRKTRPNIKIGVCGEHGGDPKSIKFFHSLKFDYVSCSPYRVPIARLTAAQAVIEEKRKSHESFGD